MFDYPMDFYRSEDGVRYWIEKPEYRGSGTPKRRKGRQYRKLRKSKNRDARRARKRG